MKSILTLAIIFIAVSSCSPLRKVQQNQHKESFVTDSLFTQLVKEEVSRSLQNFKQVEV